MFNPGDQVILRDPFWYQGTNLGGRLGIVIDTKGHVLVKIKGYKEPIKCLQYEIDQFDKAPNDPVLDDLNLIWSDPYELFRT